MAKAFEERNAITRWEITAKNPNLVAPNNKAVICGEIEQDFEYNHRIPRTRETVYRTRVITERNDGTKDYIPILVSKTLLEMTEVQGKWIELVGKIQTYRGIAEDGHRYKNLCIFVSDMNIADSKEDLKNELNENIIFIDGYVVKDAFSNTEKKASLDIAVNRKSGKKADYIPCFVLGDNVERALKLKVGDHIRSYGRFQSRPYPKKIGKITETRTAYDVFLTSKVKVLD